MRPLDVYVRVSRIGLREHLMSPDDQEAQARAFATARGFEVGEVIVDLDQSGGRADRPGMLRAIERVEAGDSGGIVVAYLDRFSRDMEQALSMLSRIERAGGHVYAPNMPEDSQSAEGEFQLGLWLLLAQRERKIRSEGFERSKEAAIRNGVPINNRPPTGYLKGPDRRLMPDPRTAPHVVRVFEMRAEGAGPAELADYLAAHRIRTSQGGNRWSKPAVYSLLRNRAYLGELSYGKPPRYVNRQAHPAIIDEGLFLLAQRPRSRPETTRGKHSYLLKGLVRCGACRHTMAGTVNGRGERFYRCPRRHAGGTCEAPAHAMADTLEARVEADFWRISEEVAVTLPHDNATARVTELEGETERQQTVVDVWSNDAAEYIAALGADAYRATLLRHAERLNELRRQLAIAKVDADREQPSVVTLRERWPTMTTDERRAEIAAAIDFAVVWRGIPEPGIYLRGSAPEDVPRRGYRQRPGLVPFPIPAPLVEQVEAEGPFHGLTSDEGITADDHSESEAVRATRSRRSNASSA